MQVHSLTHISHSTISCSHPGCDCTKGWEGPHCAHREGTYPKPQPVEKADKIAFSLFGFGVALLILGIVHVYDRRRRRRRQGSPMNKSHNRLDYDAFLDECKSSNVYRDTEESESYLDDRYGDDVEASKEESSENESYESEDESYESDGDSYESPDESTSPLYGEPKTHQSEVL